MSRIWQYLLERFHPGLMGMVSLVLGFGSLAKFTGRSWLITATALFLYLLELRLFDEFKDAAHDKKFYPNRPVPRGLVTLKELNLLLGLVLLGQTGLLVVSGAGWPLFALVQAYTWLMRHEFGIKDWLRQHFTAYLLSHEVVVLPLFLYLMSMTGWSSVGNALFLGLGLFSLEIARKTLPGRTGADDTYLEQYGLRGTQLLTAGIILSLTVLGYTFTRSALLLVPAIVLTALTMAGQKWLVFGLAGSSLYWIMAVSLWRLA